MLNYSKYRNSWVVEFLPATETKGARVAIVNGYTKEDLTIPFDHSETSIVKMAQRKLRNRGIAIELYTQIGEDKWVLIE